MLQNDIAKIILRAMFDHTSNSHSTDEGYAQEILDLPLLKALLEIYYQTAGVCPECAGETWIWVNHGPEGYLQDTCPTCQGTGKIYDIKRVAVLAEDQRWPEVDREPGRYKIAPEYLCELIKNNFKRVEEVQGGD